MEFFAGLWVGALAAFLTFVVFADHKQEVTYPMMVKAEKTCYSNQGIKDVSALHRKNIVVNCNNGAKFEFEEGDYRNE